MRIQTINNYLSDKYGETIQKIKKADAMPHILIREKYTYMLRFLQKNNLINNLI